jgi:hypothetical protein
MGPLGRSGSRSGSLSEEPRRGKRFQTYGEDPSGNYDVGALSGVAQLAEQPAVNR